ncbi:virulence factor Mce family protein [Mycobacteroides abscessus subsp. abscessus]|nr:virulence factor Mce family protein [Mycobacteroides abscessus subsp. abscessus]
MLDGNGEKIRDTLNALSGALKVGVDNKDAISNIIIKLNELTTMLAENDQSVRDFSNRVTQMSGLLAEHQDELQGTLTGLTNVTNQLRANAYGLTEVVDVAPLALQNIDRIVSREHGWVRLHALIGTALNGEIVSLFCERIQMRADGCRTGNMQDFGPDYGLTAALLGLTK